MNFPPIPLGEFYAVHIFRDFNPYCYWPKIRVYIWRIDGLSTPIPLRLAPPKSRQGALVPQRRFRFRSRSTDP